MMLTEGVRGVARLLAGLLAGVGLVIGLVSQSAHAGWTPLTLGGQAGVDIVGEPQAVALASEARVLAVGTREQPGITVLNPDTGDVAATIPLAQKPRAVALNPAGTIAYIVAEESDSISLVDLSAGRAIGAWRVGGEPAALALMGGELIVADKAGKRLIGVDTASGAVTRQLALPDEPIQLAPALHGQRLLVGGKHGNLYTIDLGSFTLLSQLRLGEEIRALAWWDVGGLAAAVHKQGDGLSLVNPDTGATVTRLTLDGDPERLALDALGGKAYVTTHDDFSVNRIDLAARALEGRYSLPARAGGIVYDPATRQLYLAQPSTNRLLRLDPAEASLIAVLQLNKRLKAIQINNATHQAVAVADKSNELSLIDLADKRVQTVPLPVKPELLAVDATRNLAVIGAGSDKQPMVFVDLGSRSVHPERIDLKRNLRALALDEGRGIGLVVTEGKDGVRLIDLGSRKLLGALNLQREYRDVAIHSGKGIAYLIDEDKRHLTLLNLDSRTVTGEVELGFKPQRIAVDDKLDLAVITTEQNDQAYVLGLASLQIVGSYGLPSHPGAIAIQPDTHVAVIASRESGQISLLDLGRGQLTPGFTVLEKPFALAVSSRYNLALALSAEKDEIALIQLPNPVPVLSEITPREVLIGSPAQTLKLKGEHFLDNSKVRFGTDALTTRWLGNGSLEADLPASLLTQAKLVSVTIETPAPGGGASQAVTFGVLNPAPVLQAVAPTQLKANGQNQTLTLSGASFLPGSQVFFGAQPLGTTFVSAGKLSALVPGTLLKASGAVPVTVYNPAPGGGASAAVQVVVLNPAPTVTGFSPASGPVGTAVTVTGTNFDALNPGANEVRFNGQLAVVTAATATRLDVIVPLKATTGPITVTTQGGSAASQGAFTVQAQQDFDIGATPTAIQLPHGGTGSTRVTLASQGLNPYQQTVGLSVTGLPSGVSYKVDRASLYLGQDVILTFSADANAASGTYTVSLVGTGPVDIATQTRTKQLTVTVLEAGATTVSGRVLHTEDDSPFVGARIRLGSQEAFTDTAGYYRFVNPGVTGDKVLLIDGHTNATDKINYPSAIAMPVMIEAGKDNVALTSHIQGIDTSKFTAITPAAETHVTVPEIPNYELRIPAGAVLMGWDGTPITQVNVRTVPVDKLPIKPLPPGVNAKTVYLYYFFREGGANPSRPIPVTMNNDIGALPGDKVDLWYYDESTTPDPNSNQWRIMGKGTVSQDGKAIVSDPGVGIPKFCCGASTASNPAPPPPPPNCPTAGNPVSLSSGAATVLDSKPFGIQGGRFPVNLSCGYSSVNPTVGFFGLGTYFNYDWRAVRSGTSAITVTAPNGERYNLALEGDGVYRAKEGRANGIGMEATLTADGIQVRRTNGMTYQFSAAGFLTAQQDPNGNRIAISRDTNNYATGITDANGRSYGIATSVIQIGRVRYTLATQITDPLGRTQKYGYDSQARLVSVTDAAGQTTAYEYDATNRIVKKTDARGAVTQYAYDAAGRAAKEILPDGAVFQFDYTVAGNTITETRVTDPNGNVTTHRFNGQGVEAKVIDALGRTFTKTVDYTTNLVTAETDPAGRTTRYTYDDRGNRTSVVDADGNTTIIEYDQKWNKPTRITNALGIVTTLEYDARGNRAKVVNGEGEATTFGYTAEGQVKTVTDALGHTTALGYDGEGNLATVSDALGNASRTRYDAANRVVEAINPRGRSQSYSYDALDRLTETVDALGGKTRFTFDAKDNLLSVVDANNHAIETNLYDLRSRLTQRTDAVGRSTQYGYDANGNLTALTDRKGQATSYSYDALDRIVQIADAAGRTTRYDYDLSGNLSLITDSESGDILLSYDRLNRLVQVSTNQGVIGYRYDVLGRRTQRTINGGDPADYAYDRANRLASITYRGKTVSYSYDGAGRLIRKTLPDGIIQTLQYDDAGRVLSLAYKKADGSVIETVGYTYDENGNRTSRSSLISQGAPETPFTATYDAANRMTSYNGYPLAYDENGNLIQRQTAQGPVNFTWDAQNRLSRIQGPNGSASFRYDAIGRRIEKTVNGQTTGYLYDGEQAIAELEGSAIGATYLTGLQIDEVLARYTSTLSRQLLTDALGSVIAQADATGTIKGQYGYSPYGETQVQGEDGNAVQYTARENDGTGLYYYRARYYDPQLKRFIGEDPIGLNGGVNVYAYVDGNPTTMIDPLGLWGGPPARGTYYPRGPRPSGPPKMSENERAKTYADGVPEHPDREKNPNNPDDPNWVNDPKLDWKNPNCVIRFVWVCKKNSLWVCEPKPEPFTCPAPPKPTPGPIMTAPGTKCDCLDKELISMCR